MSQSPAPASTDHHPVSLSLSLASTGVIPACCYRAESVLYSGCATEASSSPSFPSNPSVCMEAGASLQESIIYTYNPHRTPVPKEIDTDHRVCSISVCVHQRKRVAALRVTAPPSRCLADLPPPSGQTSNRTGLLIRPSVWCNAIRLVTARLENPGQ